MRDDQTRHDWEDRLRTGLRDLEAGTPGGGGLPGPDQVRRTHLRRRTALSGVAALATVVVAGGAVLALDRPSTSAPIAPTTTSEPAPTGTAAPEPSATSPTTDPPVTSTAPAVVVPTTIPDGFLLPHEGETAPAGSDNTDWTEVSTREIVLADSCDQSSTVKPDVAPTDVRVIEQTGPEYAFVIGLQVFSSAQEAATWVSGLRGLEEGCVGVDRGGRQTMVAEDLTGPWGQGALWVESYLNLDSQEPDDFGTGGQYTAMARVGSAVIFAQSYGEYGPALDGPDADVVADLREPLDELAPRLCVFTEAGC